MANWKSLPDDTIDPDFAAIRSLFLDGTINKMYKLIDYSPSKIIKLLKTTYSLYHDKLEGALKFGTQHILILAYAIRVDPKVILEVIQKETEDHIQSEFKKFQHKLQASKARN